MTAHVRPEPQADHGSTILACPDGRRFNADAVPGMVDALSVFLADLRGRRSLMNDARASSVAEALLLADDVNTLPKGLSFRFPLDLYWPGYHGERKEIWAATRAQAERCAETERAACWRGRPINKEWVQAVLRDWDQVRMPDGRVLSRAEFEREQPTPSACLGAL